MAEQRLRFLADAGALLAGTFDVRASLQSLAASLVPTFADWCTISLVGEDGAMSCVAGVHRDPARTEALSAYLAGFAPSGHPASAMSQAIYGGATYFEPHVTREILDRATRSADHVRALESLGCTSVIIAPLLARGTLIGALTLARCGNKPLEDLDQQFARELGALAGLAVDNARRFTAERAAREQAEHAEQELQRLLAERQQLLSEAQGANRAKDEFLAILGHELRNPLAPIVTALEILKHRGGQPSREISVIERQTEHLVRLVDDLLDVSRIARGKVVLQRRTVELAAVVRTAIEMAERLLEQREHSLAVEVPDGLTVDGDPTRLAQVVANLVTNAAKYTPPGGSIAVSARRDGDQISLRVRDNGIGIPSNVLPHVFEMFVQERQGIDRARGGLGLGLTIVKHLTEAHGGAVTARSEGTGKGSEFEVRLPASNATLTTGGEALGATRPRPGARVIVVDDNDDAASLIAEALEAWGYQTRTAHDATAALSIVREFEPDAGILDIGLPVIDGYELARRLRATPGFSGMVLVAVTGYGQPADRDRAIAAGFDHHLVKPVNIEAIRTILEGSLAPSARPS